MAEDIREAILARLLVVMQSIPGESDVARNKLLNDDGSLQQLVLVDGEEVLFDDGGLSKRPKLSQRQMKMYPLAVVGSIAKSKDVGSDLSARRGKIIKAIEADAELALLTVKNEGGRYVGIDNNFAAAYLTLAQAPMRFEFTYLLRPSQF
jgi:hypothetical protein